MSTSKKSTPYQYGVTPNPKNWHETAAAIRSLAVKPKKQPSSSLDDKLKSIEKLIKDKT